uniref:Ig-like domain-containing protein n=1 Tax=Oryzias melastigma TaxID=30732 RepID=A0A3B3C048_ORYME
MALKHSLRHIYTAFSKPVNFSGIHNFTAMGLLDDRMIYYYDSSMDKKIPKQKWMKERLKPDYWDKGTEFLRREQMRFIENTVYFNVYSICLCSDTHVLQWMHGCVGEEDKNGSVRFQDVEDGMDMYNFDGDEFLPNDTEKQEWAFAADAKLFPKMEAYQVKECMDWMDTFLGYLRSHLRNATLAAPPKVFVFKTPAKEKANIVLTCLATGFYPKDITMEIKRDGRVLTADDGLVSTGIRPNDDDTFQRREHVEILRTDSSNYTCRVIHKGFSIDVEETWDRQPSPNDATGTPIGGVVVGVVVGVGVVLIAVCVAVWCRKNVSKEIILLFFFIFL